MPPATCVWPRTRRAPRRSSSPSGSKVSWAEQRPLGVSSSGGLWAGRGPLPSQPCGQTWPLFLPREALSRCFQHPGLWARVPHG